MSKKKIFFISCTIVIICFISFHLISATIQYGEHQDKIWLHRCNSLEKLFEKEYLYQNIEVDIVFRDTENKLDVTHDHDTTYHLYLEEYFKYFSNKGTHCIWLDIKNLEKGNKESILTAISGLCEKYHFNKHNLIIESQSYEDLKLFTDNGFYTSMYVPFDKPSRLSNQEIDSCIQILRDIADKGYVKALSFPYWWYSDIKEKLQRPIDFLTWKHRTTQFIFLLSHEGKKMLSDPQLKVILVKDKGKHHR